MKFHLSGGRSFRRLDNGEYAYDTLCGSYDVRASVIWQTSDLSLRCGECIAVLEAKWGAKCMRIGGRDKMRQILDGRHNDRRQVLLTAGVAGDERNAFFVSLNRYPEFLNILDQRFDDEASARDAFRGALDAEGL